ncbi:MAG: FtsW/RodA/SpoVE family cell cycle protein [Solirubrobacterales bacterium]
MPGRRRPKRDRALPPSRGPRRKRPRAASEAPLEYGVLLTATMILFALGAVMVFSASSTRTILDDGGLADSASFLQMTLIAGAIGFAVLIWASKTTLDRVRAMTPGFAGVTLVLLLAVLVAGREVNGTTGWLVFGPATIQPAEFLKPAVILYGAYLFADRPERLRSVREMAPYLALVGMGALLVVIQPDFGSAAIVVGAALITLFVAGARLREIGLIVAPVAVLGLIVTVISPERSERILTFLSPGADPSGAGYQVTQAEIAIGSGGITGVGVGNSVQKALYLPEAHTDMILAVIGEELGLIGITVLIAVFGAFAFAGFRIAREARDSYGRILAGSLTGLVVLQAALNMYAVMGMAPLTGVPLPLVSYGNNSLVLTLLAVGLMLNVARGGALSRRRRNKGGPGAKLRLIEGDGNRTRKPRAATRRAARPDRGRGHGRARRARPGRG